MKTDEGAIPWGSPSAAALGLEGIFPMPKASTLQLLDVPERITIGEGEVSIDLYYAPTLASGETDPDGTSASAEVRSVLEVALTPLVRSWAARATLGVQRSTARRVRSTVRLLEGEARLPASATIRASLTPRLLIAGGW